MKICLNFNILKKPFEINQTQNALMREDYLENFMNRNQINKN